MAELLGLPLMPWQRHVLDVALEIDPATGRLWYDEVDLAVPRQNGKTTLVMTLLVQRCTRFDGRQVVLYFAQDRNKAREKLVDEHVRILNGAPAYAGHFKARLSNGSEHIAWTNGSKWAIDAPTRTAGHGPVVDVYVVDEAFAQEDNRIEIGVEPGTITRPSRQRWGVSTAGDRRSFYWWGKIRTGRAQCKAGRHGRRAFFEWSAPDDVDPGDEAVWRATIPALGHTISPETLRSFWSKAQREGPEAVDLFRRSYLNQWPEVPVLSTDPTGWQKITEAAWASCRDATSTLAPGARVAFAVDLSPDRHYATIAAVGERGDGLEHLEIVDHRGDGSTWVVERVAELVERWPTVAVAIDRAGPAGSLIDDLRRALPDPALLVEPTARDHAQAAGSLLDAVNAGALRHRGQATLDAAAEAARERKLGDAWAWTRTGTLVPISPLVAVTLARWAWRRGAAAPVHDPVQIW